MTSYLSKVPNLSQIIIFLCVFFMNNKLFNSRPPQSMQMNVIDYLKSKVLFYLFNSATKPTFMQNFSNICAIVLKASMDWPTPTYELYISVIQTQRYSNLLHYFDHSAKFGRFQSAKHNTMNKNVRKWPCICRKFGFWVKKVHFIA